MARFLEGHPKVVKVNYPGLESHPMHEVARKQMPGGYGGVLSFEIVGGLEAVARVLPRLRYAYMAANLGQVDTVLGHLIDQPCGVHRGRAPGSRHP